MRVQAAEGDRPARRRSGRISRATSPADAQDARRIVSASGTERSERWIVSSATRRPPPTNIIATSGAPAASASSSVCPGQGWPAARSAFLVERRRHEGVHPPRRRVTGGTQDGLGGGGAAGRRGAAPRDRRLERDVLDLDVQCGEQPQAEALARSSTAACGP